MRCNFRLITFLVLFYSFSTVFADDFFVDSESGNDLADGKTQQTAWKSLEAVNKAEIQPGDTVRFKRDGQWRGQLKPKSGEEGKPVVYTSYGDGKTKPSLLGSVSLGKQTDWVNEGDNIWATKPDTIHLGKAVEGFVDLDWGVHTEGGAKVEFKQGKIAVVSGSTRKAFHNCNVACQASGTQGNHIQLIVHGFKVEAGKYYLLQFNANSKKPFTIPSIRLSEPGAPWGGLGATLKKPGEITEEPQDHEVLFQCNQSHDDARLTISLGGALPEGADFFFNSELYEATVATNGINADVGNIILDGNSDAPKAAFKRWTKEDLTNEDDFWYDMETNRVFYRSSANPAAKYESLEAALHRHIVDHSNCSHVVFDGLDIRYGAAHGFGGTKAKHCVYRNLDISWIGGADQYKQGGKGRRVRFGNGIEFWADASDSLVEHCRIWEIYDAALTNQGAGVNIERNITYRNNLIWNSEYSFEYWNRGPESITDNVVFENNACFDAGYGWGHVQRPDKNGRHVMIYANTAKTTNFVIRGNVFCNATESLVRIDADFRNGLNLENNRYWQIEGDELLFWLVKERFKTDQLAEYQEKVGLDKTSKLQKPEFSRYPDLPKSVRR